MSSPARYSSIAVALHWLIAIFIIGQLAGGLLMVRLPDESLSLKFELFQWHKSFGITILLVSFIRLAWRLTHRAPGLPDGMSGFEKAAARFTHIVFYIAMIGIPIGGWVTVSASPLAASIPTYLFGVIPWPHLPFFENVADRAGLAKQFAELHKYAAFAMIGLLVLHIGAALKHHLVNKDDVLSRMLPFVRVKNDAQ